MASTIVSFTIISTAIMLIGLHVHHCIIDSRMDRNHKRIIQCREAREFVRVQKVRAMFELNTIA